MDDKLKELEERLDELEAQLRRRDMTDRQAMLMVVNEIELTQKIQPQTSKLRKDAKNPKQ